MRVKTVFAVIAFTIFFVGCASVNQNGYQSFTHAAVYNSADPLELFGIKGKAFEGRLFKISAKGNAYMNRTTVKNYALWAAGKAAYDNGYKEFSVLVEDGSTSTSLQTNGYVVNKSYSSNSYVVNKFNVELIILLITEKDYPYVDKIFKTSNYYQPGSTL